MTQLLQGDSAKGAADSAVTEVGGLLSSLIQPGAVAGMSGTPGEFVVAEASYPRVDSLLHLPQVRTMWPRGIELLWSGAPLSVGVNQYRMLYVLDQRPIITGESLVDATAAYSVNVHQSDAQFNTIIACGELILQ